MTILHGFLFWMLLFFSGQVSHVQADLSRNIEDGERIDMEKKNSLPNGTFNISNLKREDMSRFQKDQTSLSKSEEKIRSRFKKDPCFLLEKEKENFKNLKEAEKYLQCLLKKREVLVGDFYGVNRVAYRYVNIFDRLGYIRYKIMRIDKEIKKTELEIYELRKK